MFVPVDIDVAWPEIGADVTAMLTDPDEFGPEKLVEACRLGQAVCLKCDDGYVITHIIVNPKTGHREYVAWIALSMNRKEFGAFERMAELCKIEAARFECANVVFYSPFKAWIRKAVKAGFRIRNIEFVLPVETRH